MPKVLSNRRTGHNAGGTIGVKNSRITTAEIMRRMRLLFFETAGEIIRQRQGVVVHFGMHAQTASYQLPVNHAPRVRPMAIQLSQRCRR